MKVLSSILPSIVLLGAMTASGRRPDDFVPLSCNDNGFGTCRPFWTVVTGGGRSRVGTPRPTVIPCGTCAYLEEEQPQKHLEIPGGLEIHGKLVIDQIVTIQTPFVVVQGELEIKATKPVDGTPDVEFVLTGTTDVSFVPMDENRDACGGDRCDIGQNGFVVAGGRVNIRGISRRTPTWVHLYDVTGDPVHPTGIVVDQSVRGRWRKGAEIVITSHTTNWKAHQTRTIVETNNHGSDHVELVLDAPIDRPTTLLDSRDFAVEVALLSRNIKFSVADGVKPTSGGHVWFMNTPMVPQTLVGVEIVQFGQQGTLGRYPIHVHFCGDSSGSLIAKNTIRNSFQRCIVVHGTSNLRVEENVAFTTQGHCFIIEDGHETGNVFARNLGANVSAVDVLIPDHGFNGKETDKEPSVYWITNPSNTFVGNVAAGSRSSGFWFELMLRGERASEHSFVDPKRAPLTLFRDNVAHSCLGRAVRTYPSGYFSDTEAALVGLKVYRNSNAGVFIHNSHNITVRDAIFSDNRIGLDIDRADDITVLNSTFVGRSELYNKVLETFKVRDQCSRFNMPVTGIDLHTWKNSPDLGGALIRNVSFSGFADHPCNISVPIMLDPTIETGLFDYYSSFVDTAIENGTDPFDFCRALRAGIEDIYFVDRDGSFSGPLRDPKTGISVIVSDRPDMLQFVDPGKCTPNTRRCYTYCKNTCFRTVRFETDPSVAKFYRLKVCLDNDTNDCLLILGVRETQDDAWSLMPQVFVAHLPVGRYKATFVDGDETAVWPNFARQLAEDNLCSKRGLAHDVSLDIPTVDATDCTSLVENPHRDTLDRGSWMYRFGGLKVESNGGISGNAIVGHLNTGRTSIVQYLDNRCFDATKGSTYKISAVLKQVMSDGTPFICTHRQPGCPFVGIYTPELGLRNIAFPVDTPPSDGWQTYEGLVDIDDSFQSDQEVFLYVDSTLQFSRLYIDSVLMTLLSTEARFTTSVRSSCSNLVANSDMELGHEGFWIDNGFGSLATTDGYKSSSALHFHSRVFTWNGPQYIATMDYSCLLPGSRWIIRAQMQLVDIETGGGFDCDIASTCPAVRVEIFDTDGYQILVKKLRQYPNAWKPMEFNLFETTFELPDTFEEIGDLIVDIRDFSMAAELVVDDFELQQVVD